MSDKVYFENAYFIIGTAYAGKSTMVKELVKRHGGIACEENYHDNYPEELDADEFSCLTYTRDLEDSGFTIILRDENRTIDETVALLSKLSEAKHHIEVKVDMDELDLTSAEAKATYKEIEKWVQEHYGFHVTNLNIAQVKQKHGIIERENYNKPKSENSRQPGCPEEKVKAIEDALRQFQMIYCAFLIR